ncbi:DNA alkylation repair protein [bacterium]|nr:DNA alkylation repair protein [bacterium]
MTSLLPKIKKEMRVLADPKRAAISKWYFKTGPGEYGESDIFIGLSAPQMRALAKKYRETNFSDIVILLGSPIHEERMLALLIWTLQFSKADSVQQKKIYTAYLKYTRYVNNWDLVDLSAPLIIGAYLLDRDKKILLRLAKSKLLWERRIAILSTLYFVRKGVFQPTMDIAEELLLDEEDLIHKAVGWMLREIGKRDRTVEEKFLKRHYKTMPRTMLRYAIEKFPEVRRKQYLQGKI